MIFHILLHNYRLLERLLNFYLSGMGLLSSENRLLYSEIMRLNTESDLIISDLQPSNFFIVGNMAPLGFHTLLIIFYLL